MNKHIERAFIDGFIKAANALSATSKPLLTAAEKLFGAASHDLPATKLMPRYGGMTPPVENPIAQKLISPGAAPAAPATPPPLPPTPGMASKFFDGTPGFKGNWNRSLLAGGGAGVGAAGVGSASGHIFNGVDESTQAPQTYDAEDLQQLHAAIKSRSKAAAPPTQQSEQPGMLDGLLNNIHDNPLPWGLGAGAAGGAGLAYYLNQRNKKHQPEQEPMIQPGGDEQLA